MKRKNLAGRPTLIHPRSRTTPTQSPPHPSGVLPKLRQLHGDLAHTLLEANDDFALLLCFASALCARSWTTVRHRGGAHSDPLLPFQSS